ncbi:hypothetical protein, partial [Pseudomonas sp. ADPe]|uniref:hypothetical protein n=1 Tax=unclassified Pseudomonas TaxID=196821 RepID=UPI0009FB7F4E
MIELGRKGRDKITGFEGIITGRCQYLTGCDQYGLVPPARDGKIEGAQWFDEGRIEVIGGGITADQVRAPQRGGPNRDAPQA